MMMRVSTGSPVALRHSAKLALPSVLLTMIGILLALSHGAAAAGCPNEAFRTGLGANLPDCRAYEQVSPVDKNGGSVEGYPSLFSASEDGTGLTWFSSSATAVPGSGGSTGWYPEYLSRRVGPAWQTQRLAPPQLPIGPGEYIQATSYLGITADGKLAVAAAEGADCENQVCSSLWVIDTQTEAATQITTATGSAAYWKYALDGVSADGSRIFFETRAQLLPEATEGVPNLYMWNRPTGTLSLVGILPGEAPVAPASGVFGGAYNWPENEVYAGGALNGIAVLAQRAVSLSGDQFFFTAPEATGELGQFEYGQLFLRQGLMGGQPSTVRISRPNDGVVNPEADLKPAAFQEATPDGAHAFFLSAAKLTADATTGPSEEGSDLYRWARETEELVDIAPDTVDENGAQVIGLLGASESGSAGYFVAKGVLAPGATPGARNIYRFEETQAGKFATRYIASLNGNNRWDEANWSPRIVAPYGGEFFQGGAYARNSRVTPDGDTLLFTSANELTAFHNAGGSCGYEKGTRPTNAAGEQLCVEIYRYSHSEREVICVSCNPSGHILGADAELQPESVGGGQIPNVGGAVAFTRNLSTDGSRVFFETTEPLVAADVNGGEECVTALEGAKEQCLDVYEWESPGKGSCQAGSAAYSPQNGGCLYLISPGQSPAAANPASYFLDASADGSHVFIATNNPLVPTDIDEAFDAYDVSVEGGLAAQHPVWPAECLGEECQGPSTPAPANASPASAAIAGPGNLRTRGAKKPCRKGKNSKKCKRAAKKPCRKSQSSARCKNKSQHHPGNTKHEKSRTVRAHQRTDKNRVNGGSR